MAVVALLLMVAIGGCATHRVTAEPQPLVKSPESFSMTVAGEPELGGNWWEAFSDPMLDTLIESALKDNLSLAQAVERIEQAQAFLRQAKALRRPTVDASASAERQRDRERAKDAGPDLDERLGDAADSAESLISAADTFLSALNGEAPRGVPGSGSSDGDEEDRGWVDTYDTAWSSGLNLSWELDLWGRLHSQAQARQEELEAAQHDVEALRLVLSALVADTYYQTLEQRLQLALLQEQERSAQDLLELLELRFLQGAASIVDVLQQRGQLADIKSEVPVVEAQLGLLENRLDVLLGVPPDGAARTEDAAKDLPTDAAMPAVGVPVALLRDRPDLLALQRRVAAADYRVAMAMAERLPRLTLNGSLVYGETSLAQNVTGTGGMGLFQPLLDWGYRAAAVQAARSVFQEALLAYTEGYVVAVEEVESALWREARQRELIQALDEREAILEQTLAETRVRYSLGVTDYLPVLTAIQDLQDIQREIIRQRRVLVSLRIDLHEAVGGATGFAETPAPKPRSNASGAGASGPPVDVREAETP